MQYAQRVLHFSAFHYAGSGEEGVMEDVPYSGKFSRGAKFRVFRGSVSRSAKIKTNEKFCNAHAQRQG